jgi:hypothetical protein
MSTKFTPGPWIINAGDYGHAIAVGGKSIAAVWPESIDGTGLPHEANAHLIAASPIMAEYIAIQAEKGDEDAARILAIINGAS